MKNGILLIFAGLFLCLTGCISAVVEGGHMTSDELTRSKYLQSAKAGDMEAQYKLGESLCCSTGKSGAAYDTNLSVKWLCASARQGYAPAMYKLGKIYTGDVIDGLRLIRRATTGVTESMEGDTVNMPIGYAWLKIGGIHGSQDAIDRLSSVKSKMNSSEIRKGEELMSYGLGMPCEMNEVF